MIEILYIKKLIPEAVIPEYATDGSAGLDLTATSREVNHVEGKITYGTGLAFEIPSGHVGLIFPRSSIHKYDLTLSNCVGVIDSDYRGEVKFIFRSDNSTAIYNVGDRIGQLIIMKLPRVHVVESANLSDTERGIGGFGSTGR